MKWELPPQSLCGTYKLVATDKIDDEIYLILLEEEIGAKKSQLRDVWECLCERLQAYITLLLS